MHDAPTELARTFDVVYSWGVLHHTGQMWRAIENVVSMVKPSGVLWISIYAKGSRYPKDLRLKQVERASHSVFVDAPIKSQLSRECE